MDFPVIDRRSWFYQNCKRNRRAGAKCCMECPFRTGIELQEMGRSDEGRDSGIL